jgi:hypothetical protein
VTSYVEVPDAPSLNPSAITLDAWVNPTTINLGSRIVSKDISTQTCVAPYIVYSLEVRGEFGNKAAFFFTTSDNVEHILSGTSVIPTGVFTHIAATFDGQVAKVYVNGVLDSSLNVTGLLTSSSAPVVIGNAGAACRASNPNDVPFHGLIDEVEMSNRALSQSEIQAIVNAGSAGKCRICTPPPANLQNWWTGDGTANDHQNNNNGTWQGTESYAAGKVGQAFNFNGSSDVFINASGTNLIIGKNDFTIDAWINTTSTAEQFIFTFGYEAGFGGQANVSFYIDPTSHTANLFLRDAAG